MNLGWLKTAGSWLLGGSDNSKGFEIVKGVGSWIDEQQFTDQEKAEDLMQCAVHYGEYMKTTIDENTERSRTRRALAQMILRWWLMMLTFSGFLYKVSPEWSAYIFKIATYEHVCYLVLGIGAFFWGSHLARNFASKS